MATKKFKIDYPEVYWGCEVTIDETVSLDDLRELILFWMGGKELLAQNDGDVLKTWVQQLGREAYIIAFENNYNTVGVISEFENREGWPKMDGSVGITITFTDDVEVSYDSFLVEEVAI